ncbi:hypothetical protein BX265_1544 [Streptomyces sp. TLI_235]|nr:hypothetical protein [Streptomyces sp. TLI_235]PBC76823.1 hypothetical protein BX265_1544 [Streptomyces sp. TLI_235]
MTVRYLNDADASVPAPAATPDGEAGPDTREELGRYADQGGFALTPDANPWLSAAYTITEGEDARAASTTLAELRSIEIRAVGGAVGGIAAKAGLDVPDTLLGLSTLLDVLQRVQSATAALSDDAFSADLDALAAATGSRRFRAEQNVKLSLGRRWALRSQAKSLAGKKLGRADLHAALAAAAGARADWSALATGDSAPAVPVDGALLAETAQAIESLGTAVRALGRLLPEQEPEALQLGELADLVDRLAADEGTLFRLPALAALRTALAEQGLEDLLAELTERQADREAALAAYDRHTAGAAEDGTDAEEAARQALAAGPRDGGERAAEDAEGTEDAEEETAEAATDVTGEAEAEAVTETETETEPVAEAAVEAAEPEAVVEESVAEAVAEPVVEESAEEVVETVVEIESVSEVEPVAEAVVEPEPEPEVVAEEVAEAAEPEPEVEAGAEPEVEPEEVVEPVAEVEPVVEEPAVEPEAVVEEPAVEVEPEAVVEEPAVEVEPEAVVEEAVVEVEPVVEAEPVVEEPEVEPVVEAAAAGRPEKPEITPGKAVTAYTPAELVALVGWLDGDGTERSDDELLRAAMKELGFTRLGPRIKEALGAAVSEVRA